MKSQALFFAAMISALRVNNIYSQPALNVTCIKQLPVFKDQYFRSD